jgi:S-adenosyl-L-methionine hydrolase (adenosine-forming)
LARRPGSGRTRLVTLTSDVGAAYAAQMKAALLAGGVPPSRMVDLAHDLPAHGVREAAFLFREMARAFPVDSVHLAVVDPGVGGRRAPIVIETRTGPLLVGPDNGVLYPLAEELGVRAAYRIDSAGLADQPRVGRTFDGRDLFAPAAARLAQGAEPASLGRSIAPTEYRVPSAHRTADGARGEVVHVDRFGNLITNVPSQWVPARTRSLSLRLGRTRARRVPWAGQYEELGRRTLGLLGSSFGLVEVAVGEGRAADLLRARDGTVVDLRWASRRPGRGESANTARPRKAS